MSDQKQLRKMHNLFFDAAKINDLPNYELLSEAYERFYEFIEEAKQNPELLEDDANVNEALCDYLNEYSFAAFGIGFTLGRGFEIESKEFKQHIDAADPFIG